MYIMYICIYNRMDSGDKAMVKHLMREYPHLDQLLAETLVWAHKNGCLEYINEAAEVKLPVPSYAPKGAADAPES